jgi:multidrug efflux pump
MNISKFFIDRPIFASVLSVLLLLGGILSLFQLPISEYPEVVPPSVVVRAQYPGANPKVIAETVASPLEESINGVENMLYIQSQANSDGNLTVTVHFKLGVDPDKAQQMVQNRVGQALPRLPEDVQRLGVTTVKSSPTLTMVVHLISPDDKLRCHLPAQLRGAQHQGPAGPPAGRRRTSVWGAGNYAMRVWLDPQKVAQRGLTASEVVRAIREQNVQVAAGVIGASPALPDAAMQLSVNAQGRLQSEQEFRDIVLKSSPDGSITRLADVARVELDAAEYGCARCLTISRRSAWASCSRPVPMRSTYPHRCALPWPNWPRTSRPRSNTASNTTRPSSCAPRIKAVVVTLLEAIAAGRAGGDPVPADLARLDHSAAGGAGVHRRHLRADARLRLLDQRPVAVRLVLAIGIVVDDAIVVVENVERNIDAGLTPREATYRAMREVSGPIIAIALVLCRGLRAAGFHDRPDRAVLQAVRDDHRHLDGDLGLQLADAVAGIGRATAQGTRRRAGLADAADEPLVRPLLRRLQPLLRPRLGELRSRRDRRH